MLNVDEPDVVEALVQRLGAELEASLAQADGLRRARLLLRFAAALVVPGVLQPSSVLAALMACINAAAEIAAAAPPGDDGRSWQPYGDQLVYIALAALPFGGPELAEAAPDQLQALLDAAGAYMGARPYSSQPSLRPFFAAIKEDDPLAESDNGGASFLAQVVAAVAQMAGDARWQLDGVPRVHLGVEATLATAERSHHLAAPAVPRAPALPLPAGAPPALAAALLQQAFPARGIIRFIDAQHTGGDRPPVERLVAEDYILDTVFYFEGDRVECAKRLAHALPLPYQHEPLLCEVLFGQMLRLPRPQFKPIMYSTLMVDLCKLQKLFPRAMSACVRWALPRFLCADAPRR
jgi:nuclear cap-binding protein subunit 1